MSQANYIIRTANPSDLNFIFATWSKHYWADSRLGQQVRKTIFFQEYQSIIDYLLSVSDIRVASDASEQTIFGYSITQPPNIIHWVYVKSAFSHLGIGKSLLAHCVSNKILIPDNYIITHLTKDAEDILRNNSHFQYNPFLLFNKGN